MYRSFRLLVAFTCSLILSSTAASAAILFDFEELALGNGLTSLTSTKSGLTVTVIPITGTVNVEDPTDTAGFGLRSLIGRSPPTGFIFNFSQVVAGVSIQFGDWDADAETGNLTAYTGLNATGSVVGSDSLFYPASSDINVNGLAGTLTVGAGGIQSLRVNTTGTFPDSVWWDNLRIESTNEAVPEPGAFTIFCLGSLGLGYVGLRRRKPAR